LIDGIEIGALIGDKAFDNDWLRRKLNERGALAVIPPKANRKTEIPCDFAMCRWRLWCKPWKSNRAGARGLMRITRRAPRSRFRVRIYF
jgi:hypothetical protein